MKKKCALTLLEVIIALSLTAVLLAVLMSSATRLFSTRSLIEKAKHEVLDKNLLQGRISSLIYNLSTHVPSENGLGKQEPQGPLEAMEEGCLKLYLSRQIDPDPAFCGQITAALYLEQNNLILELFGKNDARRKEVLCKDIRHLAFQFFDPFEEPPRLVSLWKDRANEYPSHLIITLLRGQKEEEWELAFFFPSKDNFVVYHPPIKTQKQEERP